MPVARLLLLLALIGTLLGGTAHAARTVVVLDPGHGGIDAGAVWGGVMEKTLTLKIAKRVESYLKARGFKTAMTRRTDTFVSLKKRAALANRHDRSIFVSIHCNADPRRRARGIETFYCGPLGSRLAANIHRSLDSGTGALDRGLKCTRYSVLRNTRCAAALIECGFLSSPAERRLLCSPAYQDRVARAIADGIVRSLSR